MIHASTSLAVQLPTPHTKIKEQWINTIKHEHVKKDT